MRGVQGKSRAGVQAGVESVSAWSHGVSEGEPAAPTLSLFEGGHWTMGHRPP